MLENNGLQRPRDEEISGCVKMSFGEVDVRISSPSLSISLKNGISRFVDCSFTGFFKTAAVPLLTKRKYNSSNAFVRIISGLTKQKSHKHHRILYTIQCSQLQTDTEGIAHEREPSTLYV